MSLPSSLTDSSLTRAGIAAALVTASAAAVAGSTGAFSLPSLDSSHAAASMSYAPAANSIPVQRAAVTPVAATAPAAAPAVKHTSPAAQQAAKQAADQAAAAKKAAQQKAAAAKKSSSASSGSVAGLGPLGDRIVSTAASFEGTPYVYGATGPSSFDCSGFTSYVFKKMGISLPRTAQQQYDAVQHISKSQAQPGDLVFMGGSDSIYHVAIYAGNNKIWTAPEPGESVKLGNMFGDVSFGRAR
ncbi:C40 family peptidase [Actinomycetospora sp. TBRC 11914]|uniref:C40 family peptidase n=1 Tax=Actinomycetospora sp. TBRC 11914 TaxID=2729387 RepID=UPI001B7D4FEE|nr:C40 family peptidase [Actinomycetospora sp. TBRC 11914]